MTVPFAVLASGSGTNMQALLDREAEGAAYRVELLITDRPCAAEERARARGRAVHRVDFDADGASGELLLLLARHRAQGILLAGFLRLLPAEVCRAYRDRVLNIHPALLPSFGGRGMYGRRVHEAVLRSGASVSGPTIHFVSERYDEGRILAQWPVPVRPGDSADTLAARVLEVEHVLFPEAAEALARALARGWPDGEAGASDERLEGRPAGPSFCWPGAGAQARAGSVAGAGSPDATAAAGLRRSIAAAFRGAGAGGEHAKA